MQLKSTSLFFSYIAEILNDSDTVIDSLPADKPTGWRHECRDAVRIHRAVSPLKSSFILRATSSEIAIFIAILHEVGRVWPAGDRRCVPPPTAA